MNPVLSTEGLTHIYSVGTPFEHTAVEGLNMQVFPGELLGIIGHTGSGKSTLIQHLNGLLVPTAGRVLLDGQDLNVSPEFRRQARFRVGLVFQYPEYQLFEETVYKDIAFGPGNMNLDPESIDERVRHAAELVQLPEECLQMSPFDLSGGLKRRAALAGVLAMRPEVLVLDEPTAGLDPKGSSDILNEINNYRMETGCSVIMVSHSMEEIARYADRILVLNRGKEYLTGTPSQVFARASELADIGLDIPDITRLFLLLREKGMMIDTSVYTVQQAVERLLSSKGGSRLC